MDERVDYHRDELPGFIISQASKSITDLLHNNFKQNNQHITPEQWIVLDELWLRDGLSQLDIAKATFRDQASTSRILNNLAKRGLIYRQQDLRDKRSNLIYLTDHGKGLQKTLIGIVTATMDDAVKGIDERELAVCLRVLKQMTANVLES